MKSLRELQKIYKQLMYILTPKQKKESVIVFASMIILSILELLGVACIYPFLQGITNQDRLKDEWWAGWLLVIWPEVTTKQVILLLALLLILIYLIKNAFALVCTYIQHRFAASFKRVSSKRMLESYLKRPYEFFLNNNSGDLLRGITFDTSATYHLLCNTFQIASEILTIIILAIYLFVTDWFITVCAMILAMVCFLAIVLGFKGLMKKTGKIYRDALGKQNQCSYQAINGIKEITVSNRRKYFVEAFDEVSKQLERVDIINNFVTACPDRILEGVCIGGLIGIIGIKILMGEDLMNFVPVLGSFAMAAFKILPSISKISSRVNGIIYYMAGMQGCYDNLQAAEQYDKEEEKLLLTRKEKKYCAELKFQNQLTINNVTWKYKNSKKPVLKDLSLSIKRGDSIALIGASGAGKTTLADIIMGLFLPINGTVEMDGIDIQTIPQEWAHIIGYIPQSIFLIDDTVRANIAFGLPEDMISDEKIWEALERAQLKEFVENLPFKLDTIVGERGVKFSGGQRQRIAIARALYEEPDILILDEATSALDNETETAVMESINVLQGTVTLIIVAHRMTTIRNCNHIYEIKDGVAIERNREEIFSDFQ